MKKAKRVLSVFLAFVFLASLSSFGLQAAAANDSVVLTLVSNSDINPLIRFYAMKENGFDKGGPFKVEFEWKADIQRMPGKEKMNCFSTIYEMNNNEKIVYDAKNPNISIKTSTNGWVTASFSFINIKGCIDAGMMMPYGVVNIGMWYAKGTLAIRNLRITNAAGKVMYSLNDDPDVKALIKKSKDENLSKCSLRDIGLINPTPLLLSATFGDDSYDVLVTTENGPAATTTTKHGLVIGDDPTEPTNGKTTTRNPSDKTTTTGTGSTSSDPSASSTSSSSSASSSMGSDGSMTAATSGTGAAADANATTPADNKDTGKKSGLPVAGIVAIVIAAVLVLAAAVLYILAGTGKVKLPFNLPFLNKGGEAPDNGEPKA